MVGSVDSQEINGAVDEQEEDSDFEVDRKSDY